MWQNLFLTANILSLGWKSVYTFNLVYSHYTGCYWTCSGGHALHQQLNTRRGRSYCQKSEMLLDRSTSCPSQLHPISLFSAIFFSEFASLYLKEKEGRMIASYKKIDPLKEFSPENHRPPYKPILAVKVRYVWPDSCCSPKMVVEHGIKIALEM